MNKQKSRKKFKIILSVLILISIVCGSTYSLVTWNSSYRVPKRKVTVQLIEKIVKSQIENVALELNEEELNEITGTYFVTDRRFGKVTAQGIDLKMLNNEVLFYMPIEYNGYKVLISSKGTLTFSNGKFRYSPLFFKAGKLVLPRTFVLNKLGSYLGKEATIEKDSISIASDVVPVSIKSAEVKENKLVIKTEGYSSSLNEMFKGILEAIKTRE